MKSIQEAVASVQNAFPSIYTKDDVIKLLESIEIPATSSGPVISQEMIEKLIDAVTTATTRTLDRMDCSEVVDNDSAEFSIGYRNTIELDSVDVDTSTISDEIETAVQDAINEFFEEGGFMAEEEAEEDTHHGIENDIVGLERAESTHDEHSIS